MERNMLSKTVLGKRESIAVNFTLAVCHAWSDFLRMLPDPSSVMSCLAKMSLCSLDDSTINEQLSFMVSMSLIRFSFVLFWQFIIILVNYIGVWILVSLVSEDGNIISRVLFPGWFEKFFWQCDLSVSHLRWQLLKYILWLTTKLIIFVNNNNENKASVCNENPC